MQQYVIPIGNPKPEKPDEPKNDFDLFRRAMKDKGMPDADISSEWEQRKIRIARESRPPAAPKEEPRTSTMKEYEWVNQERQKRGDAPLTPEEFYYLKPDVSNPMNPLLRDKILNKEKKPINNPMQRQQGAGGFVWSDGRLIQR